MQSNLFNKGALNMRTIETTIYTFDELSDKAKEWAIEKQRYYMEYPWFDDCIKSLNAFCDEFSVRVTECTLSDCYRASIVTDSTPQRFRGVKLSSFDREAMPTGFCFDSDLRYTFHDEFKRTGDAYHAFETAIEAFLSAVKRDIEWHYSDEAIAEHIEINEYEFTEEGDIV
jgi:alcohol dehydrogenase class IV